MSLCVWYSVSECLLHCPLRKEKWEKIFANLKTHRHITQEDTMKYWASAMKMFAGATKKWRWDKLALVMVVHQVTKVHYFSVINGKWAKKQTCNTMHLTITIIYFWHMIILLPVSIFGVSVAYLSSQFF